MIGTIIEKGRRTVTSALRAVGHTQIADWVRYHHVLNRARWSGLQVSERLLLLLVATFGAVGGVTIAVDETLERRWGLRIRSDCLTDPGPVSDRRLAIAASHLISESPRRLSRCTGIRAQAALAAIPFSDRRSYG